jgi:hypothetical protein
MPKITGTGRLLLPRCDLPLIQFTTALTFQLAVALDGYGASLTTMFNPPASPTFPVLAAICVKAAILARRTSS